MKLTKEDVKAIVYARAREENRKPTVWFLIGTVLSVATGLGIGYAVDNQWLGLIPFAIILIATAIPYSRKMVQAEKRILKEFTAANRNYIDEGPQPQPRTSRG